MQKFLMGGHEKQRGLYSSNQVLSIERIENKRAGDKARSHPAQTSAGLNGP